MTEKVLAEYLRLSVEDGDVADSSKKAESDSIAHQREIICGYIREKNLYPQTQVVEIVDDGYSGRNFERPGIQRLLSMVREGRVCCIIVKDISRFGRDYLTVGDYLEQIFPFMCVRFIAINDGYDSNDYTGTTGGLEVAFKSLMYDMYSKDLSVKICSALEVRRKRGDYIGPRPPFGYRFSEKKRGLAVDETAAGYVKRIFGLACEGYSTGQIAVKLNEEAIPTPGQYKNQDREDYHILTGKGYWNRGMVLKILENRVYLGTVVNAKYKVAEIGGSHFKRVPDGERIYVEGRHEAIITKDEFVQASRVIKDRGIQKGKAHHFDKNHALSGKLKCGNCGKSMVRNSCTRNPEYFCERAKYDAGSGCFPGQVREEEAEIYILEQVNRKRKGQGTAYGKADTGSVQRDIREMKRQLAAGESRLDAIKVEKQYLYEQLKLGKTDRELYLRKVEALQEEEHRLHCQAAQAQEKRAALEERQRNRHAIDEIAGLSREIVEAYVDAVYVGRDGALEVVWKQVCKDFLSGQRTPAKKI